MHKITCCKSVNKKRNFVFVLLLGLLFFIAYLEASMTLIDWVSNSWIQFWRPNLAILYSR